MDQGSVVLERPLAEEAPKRKNEKHFSREEGEKMLVGREKRMRLSLGRPPTYPLPRSLLVGFWGTQ